MASSSVSIHIEEDEYLQVGIALGFQGDTVELSFDVFETEKEYKGATIGGCFYRLSDEDLRVLIGKCEEARTRLALAAEGRARKANA